MARVNPNGQLFVTSDPLVGFRTVRSGGRGAVEVEGLLESAGVVNTSVDAFGVDAGHVGPHIPIHPRNGVRGILCG